MKRLLQNFASASQRIRLCIALVLISAVFSSCESSAEYKKEMERLNACYARYDEHERIRHEARQERTDMWFGRMMGKEPESNTGLRMPDEPKD